MIAWLGYTLVVVFLDDFLIVGEAKKTCQETCNIFLGVFLYPEFLLSSTKLVPPSSLFYHVNTHEPKKT